MAVSVLVIAVRKQVSPSMCLNLQVQFSHATLDAGITDSSMSVCVQ